MFIRNIYRLLSNKTHSSPILGEEEGMYFLKRRSIFYLGFVLILATVISGTTIAALADSGTGASATVNPGGLSISAPAKVNVGSVRRYQTVSYMLPLTVIDATGSGVGWN